MLKKLAFLPQPMVIPKNDHVSPGRSPPPGRWAPVFFRSTSHVFFATPGVLLDTAVSTQPHRASSLP